MPPKIRRRSKWPVLFSDLEQDRHRLPGGSRARPCVASLAGSRMIYNKPFCLLFFVCILLSGCKEVLYSDLPQRQANEMLAILQANGIDSDKKPGKGGTVTLRVEKARFADAVRLLRDRGLPREAFTDLGRLFPQEGLISSPEEERIRYVYGLSQEVAETLTHIDGVITARVHVVLPQREPDSLQPSEPQPTSAAVFIKHRADADLQILVPRIKQLVQNSVAGLPYDKIAVALFPVSPAASRRPDLMTVLGVVVEAGSVGRLRGMLAGWLFAGLLLGVAGFSGIRWFRNRREMAGSDGG